MSIIMKPARAVKPGDILREELDERGWTQRDFAEIISRPAQAVNEIITGKKSITSDTAILIAQALGTSAELWLNLESAYRLRLAEAKMQDNNVAQKAALYEAAPIKEMIQKGWIDAKATYDDLQQQVLDFFSAKELKELNQQSAALFRTSNTRTPEQVSLFAWLRRAEIVAGNMCADLYSPDALSNAIPGLRAISREPDQIQAVQKILAQLGVRLVIVPHLKRTYVDGAAFWLDPDSPVIALSLRYNRTDNFWFILMHELAHILLHSDGDHAPFIDENVGASTADSCENEANSAAASWLLSDEELVELISEKKSRYSLRNVIALADRLGVHPAIVVGRLHYMIGDYTILRSLLSPVCDKAELDKLNRAA